MKKDIFNLVTVTDGTTDAAAIVAVFSEMAAGKLKSDIVLLNYYDEVPVSYSSTISAVESDSVELSVHEHQALIIKHDNSTLVKSKHFQNGLGVHCYASYVNIAKKVVVLQNFAYAQIRAERREAVRVRVREEIPVTFSYDNVTITGNMIDISGNGLSIYSEEMPTTDHAQRGSFKFTLNGSTVVVPGMFVRVDSHGDDGHISMFQMDLDRRSDTIIGQFIYQRQVEIILQLKDGQVI